MHRGRALGRAAVWEAAPMRCREPAVHNTTDAEVKSASPDRPIQSTTKRAGRAKGEAATLASRSQREGMAAGANSAQRRRSPM